MRGKRRKGGEEEGREGVGVGRRRAQRREGGGAYEDDGKVSGGEEMEGRESAEDERGTESHWERRAASRYIDLIWVRICTGSEHGE